VKYQFGRGRRLERPHQQWLHESWRPCQQPSGRNLQHRSNKTAENCRGRAGHWQTTRTCEDQHGQLQSAQTRTRCTCAGEADDKYAAGHTRRPWRCRLEKQKQRDDASVTSKNDIHCRTPGQSYEGGGRSRGHGSTDREWRKARSRRQKPYRRHHHGQLSSWQSRGDDSADRK